MNKQKVLIIGAVWPEPNSSASGARIVYLINFFQKSSYDVIFASAASDSEFAVSLENMGVEKVKIELNNKSFDTFILELQPQIVVYDRFITEEQFGWRVFENCPNAMSILDTQDLHCLRSARQESLKSRQAFCEVDLSNDLAKREIASIYRSDISLIISEFEMKLLKDFFKVPYELLFYLPLIVEAITEEAKGQFLNYESRKNFVFIGNFIHAPNFDAVEYLKKEIWPQIRKSLPEAEMHIYGAYPSTKVFNLHKPSEKYFIMGRAENAKDVVASARIVLAPLRFGAGLKGKLLEAMICGTPSVTTSIGAEGINAELDWSGVVEDSAEKFAEFAVELYLDQEKWQKAQELGVEIINKRFVSSLFEGDLSFFIKKIQGNLAGYRLSNFTGQMLRHHQLISTKYLSKWIEEKAQNK